MISMKKLSKSDVEELQKEYSESTIVHIDNLVFDWVSGKTIQFKCEKCDEWHDFEIFSSVTCYRFFIKKFNPKTSYRIVL